MDPKTYLRQIELADAKIEAQLEEIYQLRQMITKVTPSLHDDPVTGSGSQDKLGNTIAKIVDLEAEINRAIDNYVDLRKEIMATLDKVRDPDQYQVLHKRYFERKAWEQISVEMGYTYRNICYIHGKALQTVDAILKGDEHGKDR